MAKRRRYIMVGAALAALLVVAAQARAAPLGIAATTVTTVLHDGSQAVVPYYATSATPTTKLKAYSSLTTTQKNVVCTSLGGYRYSPTALYRQAIPTLTPSGPATILSWTLDSGPGEFTAIIDRCPTSTTNRITLALYHRATISLWDAQSQHYDDYYWQLGLADPSWPNATGLATFWRVP